MKSVGWQTAPNVFRYIYIGVFGVAPRQLLRFFLAIDVLAIYFFVACKFSTRGVLFY